jgi:Zn-dependent peptidase ImmA (M78 family)
MDRKRIQEAARALQADAWKQRKLLLPYHDPKPLELLEPALFAQILGVDYQELSDLGNQLFSFRGKRFKVAGLLDRQANKIAISTEHSTATQRFTAAHELGHWCLHPNELMYRDMALNGSSGNMVKPPVEQEADFFAACLLMPEKLMRLAMKELFQVDEALIFHGGTAFQISPQHSDRLLAAGSETLERELAVANCRSFGGRAFDSLAEIFRVSPTAMALRLKELKLIEWP